MLERSRVGVPMLDCLKGLEEKVMVKRMSFGKVRDAIVWEKVEGNGQTGGQTGGVMPSAVMRAGGGV